MITRKSALLRSSVSTFATILALGGLAAPPAFAATFYWDITNPTSAAGFGNAAGTWAQNSTSGNGKWTTSIDGTKSGSSSQVTGNNDIFNYGTTANGLGAGTVTVSGTVTMGDTNFGSASGAILITGGTINFRADATVTVNNTTNTIASVVDGAGTSFTKSGTGTLVLSGANTYSGATIISGGTLVLGNSAALPSGNLVLSGGVLGLGAGDFTRSDGVGANQFQWAGSGGGFAAYGADRTVNVGALSWGSTTLAGKTLILGAADSDATLIWASTLSFAGGSRDLQVDDGSAAIDAEISGRLTSSGTFNKTGSGVLSLTNATNDYDASVVVGGGVLRIDTTGALQNGNVSLSGGGILGLGEGDLTTRTSGSGANQVQWTGSGGFAAFGADRAVKFSTSSISWSDENFIGAGRTLILSHSTSDATLVWQQEMSFAGTDRTVQVDNGSAAIDASFSGRLRGGGSSGLEKTGAGTLEIANTSNDYEGATTITAGTLVVSGTISTSSGVTVSDGATLSGKTTDGGVTTGKVSAITLNGGSGTGGILSPGDGTANNVGTLHGSTLEWNGATGSAFSQMVFDLSSGDVSDKLVLSGAMTKGTGTIFEWDFGNTGVFNNTYTLVAAGSNGLLDWIASDFTYKNLTPGLTGNFTITGNNLDFTVIPEPTSALAGLLLGAGLLRRRRC
ncbi:beta strand repeat-containing protein [Haloferula sp.]|uniref:beta strand repeat-containing protein n=1 Tax=Haloferula sp. TaxID=2497595 RepID=UPI003C714D22